MKKNAFTLIELLGVLLLLAVIALITFPIIDNTLTNSRNEAYERQKDNIIEAARMYVTENGNYNANKKQLSFQTLIDAGFLKDGDILDPRDSSKKMTGCILYNWNNSKNQYIYEYSEECILPIYAVGDLLKVQVSDSETQNIYVLEVNDDEVVGILDRNLGSPVAWISEEDYSSVTGSDYTEDLNNPEKLNQNLYKYGPVTANKVLEERTSTWSNVTQKYLPSFEEILKLTEFYQELEDKSNWEEKYYAEFDYRNWGEEILDICANSSNTVNQCRDFLESKGLGKYLLPDWLMINLYRTGNSNAIGYWTSTPTNYSISSRFAWYVNVYIYQNYTNVNITDTVGIRPVIHISQSNIISKLASPEYVNPDDVG